MKWDDVTVFLCKYFDHIYCLPRRVKNYFRNAISLLEETFIQQKPQVIVAKTIYIDGI